MSYMDHWRDHEPSPSVVKDYRVGIRFIGSAAETYFYVKAQTIDEAKTLAMREAMSSIRTGSCLSKSQY
jgi:hypothetical protein